jgi:hypothetical protein
MITIFAFSSAPHWPDDGILSPSRDGAERSPAPSTSLAEHTSSSASTVSPPSVPPFSSSVGCRRRSRT